MLKIVLRWLLGFGVFVVIAYLGVCLLLFLWQTRFIFFPYRGAIATTPELFHLNYKEVWLPVQALSGKVEHMYCWWIPVSEPDAKVLLYLHGNGSNIGAAVAYANLFHQLGFSVLVIDYRGYGRSEGSFPTEAQVYQDASTAWDYLVKEQLIPPSQIFVFGHSLGGAIAINLAVQHPDVAGLIVESAFTSMRQMVDYQGKYWMFPVNLILNQRFDSIDKIKSLQVPILFIHGTADSVVPYNMSQQLFVAAPGLKQLVLVPGAGHNNVAEVAGSQYCQEVQKFVQQVQARQEEKEE
ncbi:MAG: alpha/beta fold hydrolase [Chroococcidiopsidaceae cyanobacterium CP_BM_RX_35]|nr:alpha/beta fold hydrolase [Chroococcidiopsidaceae cyanobacterium CP_BM_RX_35]